MEGEVPYEAVPIDAVEGVEEVQEAMTGESEVLEPEAESSQPQAALLIPSSISEHNQANNAEGQFSGEQQQPVGETLNTNDPPPLSFAELWPPAPAPQRPSGSIGPVDPPTTGLARQVASMMLSSGTYDDQLREHNRLHYGGEQEIVGPLGRVRGPMITASISS
ncbi:hypothetical protein CEUSTIGMA_g10723.t1 [Chlamydomonas eustigma]|uniref:Uncharacterized protein n=1 Tax=Chlamydomonas eustigma TaxID=1157962 RepID=A0A250XJP5_9CHLO|nr:hypothetical protein CEUSTIGMA_g10723.t1 [Chlamydomonas eustigma]|eukprot:GAX83297.1 hypothetical protein CEUSTIGMA_g10723.t1 [Chlamydomonas eustigma]